MKSNVSFINKAIAEKSYSLQLLEGSDGSGNAVFKYVLFNKLAFQEIEDRLTELFPKIEEYGIIVYEGKGSPSEDDKHKALEIFNRDYLK